MPPSAAKPKAIVLFSGGLDSALAIELMLEQGIEVVAVNFTSPFCTCNPKATAAGGCHVAAEAARQLGVEIRMLSKGMEYLKVIKSPRFGRGRGLNACIDCRIFVLRKAREMMSELGASFVVTGEVLGQRPMSQHRRALELIERESGLTGRLLRPLSAHCLPPTIPELEGVVDRARLLELTGRSRRAQLDLARDKGIELFTCATGGCLLTDPSFARRAADLFAHGPYELADVQLLRVGRHYRLREGLKVILGRDDGENRRLAAAPACCERYELVGSPGPLLLAVGEPTADERQVLGRMIRAYAPRATEQNRLVKRSWREGTEELTVVGTMTKDEIERWRL